MIVKIRKVENGYQLEADYPGAITESTCSYVFENIKDMFDYLLEYFDEEGENDKD